MPDHLVLYTAQFKKLTDFSKFIDKIRNFLRIFRFRRKIRYCWHWKIIRLQL